LKSSKGIKVGLLVVFSIGILYWGINFLKGRDIFKKQRTFYAIYDNTESLMATKPVTLNGYKVGMIESIVMNPLNPSEIVVKLSIEYPIEIPKNSHARIYSIGLLGEKQIEILYSSESALAIPGDTLIGDKAVGLMDNINERLDPIVEKADALFGSADNALKTLVDEENAHNISRTIAHLAEITATIDLMTKANEKSIEAITQNLSSITTNLRKNNADITVLIQNLRSVSEDLNQVAFNEIAEKLEATVNQTQELIEKINSGDGTLSALINDKQLYDNLNMTSFQLNRLLVDFRKTPKRYVHFSMFGKNNKPADETAIDQKLEEDKSKLNNR
jgi:phospholipid/cholesterol/gamma-HCH transport system substrate-binding protein